MYRRREKTNTTGSEKRHLVANEKKTEKNAATPRLGWRLPLWCALTQRGSPLAVSARSVLCERAGFAPALTGVGRRLCRRRAEARAAVAAAAAAAAAATAIAAMRGKQLAAGHRGAVL